MGKESNEVSRTGESTRVSCSLSWGVILKPECKVLPFLYKNKESRHKVQRSGHDGLFYR